MFSFSNSFININPNIKIIHRKKVSAEKRRHQRADLDFFLDLSVLTDLITQVVELRTANFTAADNFNRLYVRGVDGEGLFGADTVGNSSYSEGFGNAAVLSCDNGTFKDLSSDSCSLDDSLRYLNGITNIEFGDFGFELLICKCFQNIQSFYLHYSKAFVRSRRGPPVI